MCAEYGEDKAFMSTEAKLILVRADLQICNHSEVPSPPASFIHFSDKCTCDMSISFCSSRTSRTTLLTIARIPASPCASPPPSAARTLFSTYFPHHIHLDVHLLARPLLRERDLLLRVLDQHHAERALRVVDGRQRERRAVERDVALRDQVLRDGGDFGSWRGKLEEDADGVAVGREGQNRRSRIYVCLRA